VLLADLISFVLKALQGWMTQAIIQNLVASHSVLTNTPEPVSTLPVMWTIVFGISQFLVEFVNLCLYATAMIAISVVIPALIAQTKLPWRQIVFAVRRLRVQVLLFSLQVFGMLVIAMSLDMALATYLPQFRLFSMLSTINGSRAVGLTLIALLFAAVAWLMAPAALSLLRPPQSSSDDTESRRQA
jgi:hypothetical protein